MVKKWLWVNEITKLKACKSNESALAIIFISVLKSSTVRLLYLYSVLKKLITILLLFGFLFSAKGQNIILVTNNADNGPGSLRSAIERCSGNGQIFTDTIKFNLDNAANRIIILDSELPDITSNVIIDGTSQPGPKLSNLTDAKIVIRGVSYPQVRRGLTIINATNVGIYGLAIVNFIPTNPISGFNTYGDGIFMQNVSEIEIGRVQGGNVISGNYYGIRIDSIPLARPGPPLTPSFGIKIYNNNIGPQAGINTGGSGFGQSGNIIGIYCNGIKDFIIGNILTGTGFNTFESVITGLQVIIKTLPRDVVSTSFIGYNTFNPAGSFNPALSSIAKTAINVGINPLNSFGYNPVVIQSNIINQYNNGITLANLKNNFTITQNELTCAAAPPPPLPHTGVGIAVSNCDSGVIGGTIVLQNLIDKFPQGAVANFGNKYVTISKNSIICSGSSSINGILHSRPAAPVPVIVLDSLYPLLVTGSSGAGCKIEMFRNDQCLSQMYNGKTYDTTLVCDANGKFRYDGRMDCNTSFTSTNSDGTTSLFYVPYNFIFDSSALQVTPSTCEREGRIFGIKFFKNVEWEWQNEAGGRLGSDTNLVAMGGKYRLVARHLQLGCTLQTSLITIPEYNFEIDSILLQVLDPYVCKPNAGKITGIKLATSRSPTGPLKYEWKNQLGNVLGNALNLINLPAGTYTLRIISLIDATCFKEAGPYTLTLKPSPVMDISQAIISQDTCGNNRGNITGVAIITPGPAGAFLWVNDAGTIVGVDANLAGVPAGRYRLKYKDASPCDTLYSPWYTINDNGKISINVSAAIIKPSGCGRNTGAITNVTTTNATNFYWIYVKTGDTVATNINASNLAAGIYRLLAVNAFGCSRTSANLQVDSTVFINLKVVTVNKQPASCDSANGFVSITQFNSNPSFHQLAWLSATGLVLGSSATLTNIDAGIYRLMATDSNGCSKIIFTDTTIQTKKVTINIGELYKEADTCGLRNGRFSNIMIRGGTSPYGYLITDSMGRFVSSFAGATGLSAGIYSLKVFDVWGCTSPVYQVPIALASANLPTPDYKSFYVLRGSDTAISLAMPYSYGGKYQLLDAGKNLISENITGRFIFLNMQNDFNGFVRLSRGSCVTPDAVVKIIIADTLELKIPNAFSPNGDGINDVFTIRYKGVPLQMEVIIFDRYGKLIYKTTDFNKPWNGNSNSNKPMPAGTYYWIVKGKDILGISRVQQGSVTLLK